MQSGGDPRFKTVRRIRFETGTQIDAQVTFSGKSIGAVLASGRVGEEHEAFSRIRPFEFTGVDRDPQLFAGF